jgi:hypothetical protein
MRSPYTTSRASPPSISLLVESPASRSRPVDFRAPLKGGAVRGDAKAPCRHPSRLRNRSIALKARRAYM